MAAALILLLLLATLRLCGSTESPEAALLARLGFKRAPKPSGPVPAASVHLLHLFQILDEEGVLPVRLDFGGRERDIGFVTTVVSHALTECGQAPPTEREHTLQFNTSIEALQHDDDDVAVELRLLKRRLPAGLTTMTLSSQRPGKTWRVEEVRQLDTSTGGWESFDLSPLLLRRLHITPEIRLSVKVTSSHLNASDHFHLRHRRDLRTEEAPQLVSYHRSRRQVRHNRNRRRRRKQRRQTSSYEQLPHVPPDLDVVCQRRPLHIRFRDVGWDSWIVAPEGFEAGMCSGQCPFPLSDIYNSTNHAIIQMLMHSVAPVKASPPSCVPVKLNSKPILYLGNNNEVILKTYDDMEVEFCGCR